MSLTDVTDLLNSGQDVVDSAVAALEATRVTQTRIEEAMDFTDEKISEHNTDPESHSDIREEITIVSSTDEEVIQTPIVAQATVRVPAYIVGSHRLCVYIDGVKCLHGTVYQEIGDPGTTSTSIRFTSDISADYEVSVSC